MTFLWGRGCFFIRHTGSPAYTSISQEQNSQINKLDVECDKQTNNNLYIFNESMFLKFHISSPLFCFPSFRNTVINTDQQLIQKKYVWQLATAAKSGSVTLLAFTYSFKIPYAANIQLDLCKAVCSCWAVCCSCLIRHICLLPREQNLFINSFLFLLSLDFWGMFPGSIRPLKKKITL